MITERMITFQASQAALKSKSHQSSKRLSEEEPSRAASLSSLPCPANDKLYHRPADGGAAGEVITGCDKSCSSDRRASHRRE